MDLEFVKTIANYGVPAVLLFFLLFKLNGTVSTLKDAITANTTATNTVTLTLKETTAANTMAVHSMERAITASTLATTAMNARLERFERP